MNNNVVVVPLVIRRPTSALAAILSDDVIKLRGVFTIFIFFFLLFYRLLQCVYGEIDRRVGERFRLTVF